MEQCSFHRALSEAVVDSSAEFLTTCWHQEEIISLHKFTPEQPLPIDPGEFLEDEIAKKPKTMLVKSK